MKHRGLGDFMVGQNIYCEQLILWEEERISWSTFSPEIRDEIRRLIGQLLWSELSKNRKEDNDGDE